MDQKPFTSLTQDREVAAIPTDLREFYARHEGVGLDSPPDRLVRLCKLNQVVPITWRDLHLLGSHPPEPGWEQFTGHRVGISRYFDEIIIAECSPVCSAGSIITFGPDVPGPGGDGPDTLEYSLVLAADFSSWLARLEEDGWTEYGLIAGAIGELPAARASALRKHFKRLNPGISWG